MIIFVAITFHYPNMDKDINRIKVVLAEKKRTNKWLAEQLGCAPTTVSKWCTNACQPPMETYIKIAKLLNITIEELINKEYVNSVFPETKENLIIYKDIH
jgi:DNA-binding XRE family transcriptional regulator